MKRDPKTLRPTYLMVIVAFMTIGLSLIASAASITTDYTFERPRIESISIAGEMYDRVVIPSAPNSGKVGQPALPAAGARILIPYGHDIENIEVHVANQETLGEGFIIEPVASQVTLSGNGADYVPATPDAAIYGGSELFPPALYENVTMQNFRGYRVLHLKLQPVQWNPSPVQLAFDPRTPGCIAVRHHRLIPTVRSHSGHS